MTALHLLLGVTKLDKLRNENIREQLSMNETILQVYSLGRTNDYLIHVLRIKDNRIAKNILIGRTEGKGVLKILEHLVYIFCIILYQTQE